jgi:hypothetical protein
MRLAFLLVRVYSLLREQSIEVQSRLTIEDAILNARRTEAVKSVIRFVYRG